MKKYLYFSLTALLLTLSGCQTENTPFESSKISVIEKSLEPFKRILVKSSNAYIYIKQGDVESLKIEVAENLIGTFSTVVENESLIIEQKSSNLTSNNESITLHITVKNIHSLSLFGHGELISEGTLEFDKLKINISGDSKLDLDLKGEELLIKAIGSSQINVKGSVELQKIAVHGNSIYNALDFSSKEADISLDGSGQAKVYVSEILTIKIFGSGIVKYRGSPQINQTVSGSGIIEAAKKKSIIKLRKKRR